MMSEDSTRRIPPPKQSLDEAYSPPANYLEIDISSPETHGEGRGRYTDYRVHMRTNLPIFKVKESTVRRRYSDFKWLRDEISRTVQIVVPTLPGKAFMKQLPFVNTDNGIFHPEFVEERMKQLEDFINKVAGHPLVQSEKCLHVFLTEPILDRINYVPGRVQH